MVAFSLGCVGSFFGGAEGGDGSDRFLSGAFSWDGSFCGDPFVDVEYFWAGLDCALGDRGAVHGDHGFVDREVT